MFLWNWGNGKEHRMKRVLLLVFSVILGVTMFAQQKDVTKFLGIPVDGTKAEMIQKLKLKGYVWNAQKECLEGEFNGRDVEVFVVTNNNKVYRIAVIDAEFSDEIAIKIRFNTLCEQFKNNGKYVAPSDYTIDKNEDISYEISVNNKRYEATYSQISMNDTAGVANYFERNFMKEEIENFSKEQIQDILLEYLVGKWEKRQVWFMIAEKYGRYRIAMYYDNGYNQANGEDL